MSNWIINLTKIGRGKITRSLTVKYHTLPEVEQRAIRECKKHLMSRDVNLGSRGDLSYRVLAGFRPVGTVHIQAL